MTDWLKDSSSNGNNLTSNNASQNASGKMSQCAECMNATDEGLNAPDQNYLDLTGDMTVECWVKLTSFANTWSCVLTKGYGWNNPPGDFYRNYAIFLHNTGFVQFSFIDSTDTLRSCYTSTTPISTGSWIHIACVFDQDVGTKIYVNGTAQAETADDTGGKTPQVNGSLLQIGQEKTNGANNMDGLVDEVRVSTGLRYTSNFTPQTTPFENDATTVALYHFDTVEPTFGGLSDFMKFF